MNLHRWLTPLFCLFLSGCSTCAELPQYDPRPPADGGIDRDPVADAILDMPNDVPQWDMDANVDVRREDADQARPDLDVGMDTDGNFDADMSGEEMSNVLPCVDSCPEGLVCVDAFCIEEEVFCSTQPTCGPFRICNLSKCIESLTVGTSHACAARTDGSAVCWGRNNRGQVNPSNNGARLQDTLILPGEEIEEVAAGQDFTCARTRMDEVFCWGANTYKQTGHGSENIGKVPLPGAASSLTAGASHACAVVEGAVICWGDNGRGQVNTTNLGPPQDPTPITGIAATRVFAHTMSDHTCAVDDTTETAHCWGSNYSSEIPSASDDNIRTPTRIVSVTDPSAVVANIAMSDQATCVVFQTTATAEHFVECWGSIGNGDNVAHRSIAPASMEQADDIAVMTNGALFTQVEAGVFVAKSLGTNILGSLGLGLANDQIVSTPTPISLDDPSHSIRDLAAGRQTVCATINSSAGLYCWGENSMESGLVKPNEFTVEHYNTPEFRLLSR